MREILFRGKTLYHSKWVYGYFALGESDNLSYIIPKTNANETAKPVFDESVGQYTGLTDKNGVKIFEGDIFEVKIPPSNSHEREIISRSKVVFHNGSFGFETIFGTETKRFPSIGFLLLGSVIGNIYDNPELLTSSVE